VCDDSEVCVRARKEAHSAALFAHVVHKRDILDEGVKVLVAVHEDAGVVMDEDIAIRNLTHSDFEPDVISNIARTCCGITYVCLGDNHCRICMLACGVCRAAEDERRAATRAAEDERRAAKRAAEDERRAAKRAAEDERRAAACAAEDE
jgi:hypothetical protein